MSMKLRSVIGRAKGRPLKDYEWSFLVKGAYIEDIEADASTVDDLIAGWPIPTPYGTPVGKHAPGTPVPVSPPVRRRAQVLAKFYGQLADADPTIVGLRAEIEPRPKHSQLVEWIEEKHCESYGLDGPEGLEEQTRLLLGSRRAKRLFPSPAGDSFFVPGESLLAEIAICVERLANSYPWSASAACRWLICGDPSPATVTVAVGYRPDGITPVDAGADVRIGDRPSSDEERAIISKRFRGPTDTRWRITLEIDPAIAPAEVGRLYAAARSLIAPTRVRPLTVKKLDLADFILDQPEPFTAPRGPEGEIWDIWLNRWNRSELAESHGKYDAAGSGRWNFRRDGRDAMDGLRFVGWTLPG